MLDTLRKRLTSEKGFTLIELLVVMIILAILTAIAIPSYLSFRDRANKGAAAADLRAAVPSIEAYAADNRGAYDGMTAAEAAGVVRPGRQPEHHPGQVRRGHELLRPGDRTGRCHEAGLQDRTAGRDPDRRLPVGSFS